MGAKSIKRISYAMHDPATGAYRHRALTDNGFVVNTFGTAAEVLDSFKANGPPDLLITHAKMPHSMEFNHIETHFGLITGVALYRRARGSYRHLPVIIYTEKEHAAHVLQDVQDPLLSIFRPGALRNHVDLANLAASMLEAV